MDITLSIIVPVYNAEKYLKRCVDSILSHLGADMEVILVDDGSTDGSSDICDRYAEAATGVRVIHKANGGLVSARKAGLQESKGQFIGWVDSDDWIETDYFGQMLQVQSCTGADIVVSDHFHDIGQDSKRVRGCFDAGMYTNIQLLPKLLYAGAFFSYGVQPHVWSKIFRRDILEKVLTEVDNRIVAGEDAAIVYPGIVKAQKICITEICKYHYVQNGNSITKTNQADEWERIRLLFDYLKTSFINEGIWKIMSPQMEQYKKYFLFMRQMSVFDLPGGQVLSPYGGIPEKSRVIIYGAGGSGQRMYRYLSETDGVEIVLWVDRNAAVYVGQGMQVAHPDLLKEMKDYDCILVANTAASAAEEIISYLKGFGIPEGCIKWFTEKFIQEDVTLLDQGQANRSGGG